MIARIKKTGKLIDVVPYGDEFAQLFPEGDFKVYTKDELDFRVDVDWQQVRIQAAIAVMQGMTPEWGNNARQYAEWAVQVADALVAELKRSDDVYAECRRMDAINTASVCENMTKIQKELQKKDDNANIQQ